MGVGADLGRRQPGARRIWRAVELGEAVAVHLAVVAQEACREGDAESACVVEVPQRLRLVGLAGAGLALDGDLKPFEGILSIDVGGGAIQALDGANHDGRRRRVGSTEAGDGQEHNKGAEKHSSPRRRNRPSPHGGQAPYCCFCKGCNLRKEHW